MKAPNDVLTAARSRRNVLAEKIREDVPKISSWRQQIADHERRVDAMESIDKWLIEQAGIGDK